MTGVKILSGLYLTIIIFFIWLLTNISEIYIMLYLCIYCELQCTLKVLEVVFLSGTSIQRASRVLFDDDKLLLEA